jgi:GTPase Era involved in 16S rRNA processing
MKKATLNHSTHRKEAQSKRNFEKLIEPSVVNWHNLDYGVDGTVQLFSKDLETGSAEMESTYYLVQLKSTTTIAQGASTFSFPTDVNKIQEWLNANLSVLLVVNDLTNEKMYCKWINDELMSNLSSTNPSWLTKNKIAIKFTADDLLTPKLLKSFNDYLSRISQRRSLLPGQYFQFRDRVKELLDRFQSLSAPFNFGSPERSLSVLSEKLESAIYRIAIAGPSRAGKSTLINALLRKNISPVGIYQTTGVPIQVIPGKKDKITIYFKDNTTAEETFSVSAIKKYASQTENLSNIKKVKFVSVTVVNTELEKGISFFDVPGLDDPDDEILIPTLAYVKSCNAIVYLIDASSMATGGFAFKSEYKNQIREMSSTLDKVFLVLNKVDSLTADQLESLISRVEYDLKRLDLHDKIDDRISYVSADKSLESRLLKKSASEDSILNLEQHLWRYLLDGNKTGVYRLLDIIQEMFRVRNEFADIMNTRLLNSEKLEELHDAIKEMEGRIPDLYTIISARQSEIQSKIRESLLSKKYEMFAHFEQMLKAIPKDKPLPTDSEIKKLLLEKVQDIMDQTNEMCYGFINQYKQDTDVWIERNLKKIREIINSEAAHRQVDFTPIETMTIPDVDMSSAFGMGVLGAIVGFVMNPAGAILGALAGFFGHLLVTSDARRANKITKLMDSIRLRCDIVFLDLQEKFNNGTDELLLSVHKYAINKMALYFTDLNGQIDKIQTGRLSDQEKEQYQETTNDLRELDIALNAFSQEVIRFT